MKSSLSTRNLVLSGLFVAIGLVLPTVFHFFGGTGPVFLPMHIPVLLCGLLLGYKYGAICGALTPLLSSIITGMPPLFPIGIGMILELFTYGIVSGFMHKKLGKNVYISLITAMIAGRIVSGITNAVMMGVAGKPYGFEAFLTAAFVTAIPGILVQLVFIPVVVKALKKVV